MIARDGRTAASSGVGESEEEARGPLPPFLPSWSTSANLQLEAEMHGDNNGDGRFTFVALGETTTLRATTAPAVRRVLLAAGRLGERGTRSCTCVARDGGLP